MVDRLNWNTGQRWEAALMKEGAEKIYNKELEPNEAVNILMSAALGLASSLSRGDGALHNLAVCEENFAALLKAAKNFTVEFDGPKMSSNSPGSDKIN